MKKAIEEILKEQGIEQVSIFDILYPERKGKKNEKHDSRLEQPSI